jgi:hypothetical protein
MHQKLKTNYLEKRKKNQTVIRRSGMVLRVLSNKEIEKSDRTLFLSDGSIID